MYLDIFRKKENFTCVYSMETYIDQMSLKKPSSNYMCTLYVITFLVL